MSDLARYDVALTPDARSDLAEIARYRAAKRGRDDADALLDAILATIATPGHFPLRGPVPKELFDSGEAKVHQTLHGVYRVLYEVEADAVTVFLIADGRRDMQKLLRQRLIGRPPPG